MLVLIFPFTSFFMLCLSSSLSDPLPDFLCQAAPLTLACHCHHMLHIHHQGLILKGFLLCTANSEVKSCALTRTEF